MADVITRWSSSRHARYYHAPGISALDTVQCGGDLHIGNLNDGPPPLTLLPCPTCYRQDIETGRRLDERDFPGMLNPVLPKESGLWETARELFAEGYTADTVIYGAMVLLRRPAFQQTPGYLRGIVQERMHRQRALPDREGIEIEGRVRL